MSSSSSSSPYSSSLASIVCRWSPSNFPQLAQTFTAACKTPQTTFPAYEHYKTYFEPLLFAEIIAELQSAFDKYQRSASTSSPHSHSHRPVKIRSRREEAGTNPALVSVQKVNVNHTHGFGCTVDVDPCDKKGPVGCYDNDVAIVWSPSSSTTSDSTNTATTNSNSRSNLKAPRQIPTNHAVLATVVRAHSRNGCRLLLAKFPSDPNRPPTQTDLEEGEETDDQNSPTIGSSTWYVLRLGSLTTIRREFDALQNIRTSGLLPTLMKPSKINSNISSSGAPTTKSTFSDADTTTKTASTHQQPQHKPQDNPLIPQSPSVKDHLERNFTGVVAEKLGLNSSQTRAILHASTCQTGFSVIQGPPGTGKTRTLIGLLNVIHMTQYHKFYEGLLSSLDSIHGSAARKRDTQRVVAPSKSGEGSLLETMMMAMNQTVEAAMTDRAPAKIFKAPAKRPRLLICAPSNSAVDEIVTRLMHCKFYDGHGRTYCPELARIGAGDKVSDAVKALTAEGQAESFLDRLCPEGVAADIQKEAQKAYMADWQMKSNHLLVQLDRTPKTKASSRGLVVELYEKLERMERDLRRLSIAASDHKKNGLSREDKLRLIARTYVEDAQLVFATLSGSASNILTKTPYGEDAEARLFDTVVIDEAAQATETSCLIPMTLGCSRCLLVGDPQQLPATVLSSGAAGLSYGQSLLERVFHAGLNVQLLDTQYRMHPAISSFPRRYFYSGRLVDDETVQGEHRARAFHRDAIKPKLGPYVFLDISEGQERRSKDDRSIFNQAEAELAAMIYSKLKKDYPSDSLFTPASKMPGSVTGFGVVTPYKRQMQELRQSFERAGVPTGDVEIDTVDSFQGREKDVVVFSCVRTAAMDRGIGFVRDVRRMNVGLTRARATLIILGSAQALAEGSKDWAELVEDASSRGCMLTVNNVERCLLPAGAHPPKTAKRAAVKNGQGVVVSGNMTTLTNNNNNNNNNSNTNETNIGVNGGPAGFQQHHNNAFMPNGMKRLHGNARMDPRMDPRRRAGSRAAAAGNSMQNSSQLLLQQQQQQQQQFQLNQQQQAGIQPPLVGMQQPQVGMQPQQVGMQPQQVGMQPQQAGMLQQQAGMQPQQVGMQQQGGVNATGMAALFRNAGFPENGLQLNRSNQPGNGSTESEQDVQDDLNKLLSAWHDSGFQDNGTMEILQEHLIKGGKLDVETVVAAALASNNNQLPQLQQQLMQQQPPLPGNIPVDIPPNNTIVNPQLMPQSNVSNPTVRNELMNQAMMNEQMFTMNRNDSGSHPGAGDSIQNNGSNDDQKSIDRVTGEFRQLNHNVQQDHHHQQLRPTEGSNKQNQVEQQKQKREGQVFKEEKPKTHKKKKPAGEPSGWEMLFGGGGDSGGGGGGRDEDEEDDRRNAHRTAGSGSNKNNRSRDRGNRNMMPNDARPNREEVMRKQQWSDADIRNGKRPLQNGWNANEAMMTRENHPDRGMVVPDSSEMQDRAKRARNGWGNDNNAVNLQRPDGGMGGRPVGMDQGFGGRQRVGGPEYHNYTNAQGLVERDQANVWNGGGGGGGGDGGGGGHGVDGDARARPDVGGVQPAAAHGMGYGNGVMDNNGMMPPNMNMMGGMGMGGVGNGQDMAGNGNMNMMGDPSAGSGTGGVGGMSAAAAAAAAMGMFGEPEAMQALHQQMMQQQQVAWQQQQFQQQQMQQQALLMQQQQMSGMPGMPNNGNDNNNNVINKNMGGGAAGPGGWYTGGFDQQVAAAAAAANVGFGGGSGGANGFMNDSSNHMNMGGGGNASVGGGGGGGGNGHQWGGGGGGGDRSRDNRQFRNARGRTRGRGSNNRRR